MARMITGSTRETSKDMPRWSQRVQPGKAEGTSGESMTGQRDELYGVVSVLYHALQGAETYGKYIGDAQKAGDSELAQFFESCRAEEEQRAVRAKSLLAERLEDEGEGEGEGEDEDEDEED